MIFCTQTKYIIILDKKSFFKKNLDNREKRVYINASRGGLYPLRDLIFDNKRA